MATERILKIADGYCLPNIVRQAFCTRSLREKTLWDDEVRFPRLRRRTVDMKPDGHRAWVAQPS
jgi:hypothetical protein